MPRSQVKDQGHKGQKRGFRPTSLEPLNGFAPNLQIRRVWSLARTTLEVKVNFGRLRAVYVWKNIFALVFRCFLADRVNGSAYATGCLCVFCAFVCVTLT